MAKQSKKILSREAFLGGNSMLKKALCDLPEFGGSVWVRELSGKALSTYNMRVEEMKQQGEEFTPIQSFELMGLLVSLAVVDENGDLMFSEADATKLADNSLSVLMKLSEKALELSGISPAAIAEVKENLKNAQTSASTAS